MVYTSKCSVKDEIACGVGGNRTCLPKRPDGRIHLVIASDPSVPCSRSFASLFVVHTFRKESETSGCVLGEKITSRVMTDCALPFLKLPLIDKSLN